MTKEVKVLVKKINDVSLTVEDLKQSNEQLYNEIFNIGVSSVSTEVASLKKEVASLKMEKESAEKIRSHAKTLNLSEMGEELISKNTSVEDALSTLISESVKGTSETKISVPSLKGFIGRTAPKSVAKEGENVEFSSYVEARDHFISENKMTRAEAARHVKKNYPGLK